MTPADKVCDEFDAAVFSGDAFIEQRDLVVLQTHLTRWQREASNRLQAIQREREKGVKVSAEDDDLA